MALTTRGAGKPDYSGRSSEDTLDALRRKFVGSQQMWSGSVVVRGFIGSIEYLHRLGTTHYVERMGTVGHVGSQPYLGYVGTARVRSGSIRTTFAAQDIMVGVDQQARYYTGAIIRGSARLGKGTFWIGSWQGIGSFRTKSYFYRLSRGGSIGVVVGMTGSGQADHTGTYYGPVRIGAGSLQTVSFTEAFGFARPFLVGGGTSRVSLGRQV